MPQASSPIGVFDSGVGGLSVLRALLAAMPHERFVYLADSANAPYGERGDAFVAARTHAITDYLCQQHHIKALVVACNTPRQPPSMRCEAATQNCPWWAWSPP